MADPAQCGQCGATMAGRGIEGLCPRCLAKAAFTTREGTGQPNGTRLVDEAEAAGRYPVPGRRFGDYEILRLLGRGAMGAVYEAVHTPSGRRMALKVLTHSFGSTDARRRFLREGRLAASVNHPNSVYVYGTEEIDGTPAITMELIPGGSLSKRIREDGAMSPPTAVAAIMQVVSGLAAAQASGVLHRDVKPSNCFVDIDGTVKVGDYGISISALEADQTQLTAVGSFVGTPAFSSPEQLQSEDLDVRADIYSVGATLYYLLTGEAPFKGEDLVNLVAAALNRTPSPVHQVRDGVPVELSRVVMRCLEKDRSKRFPGYRDLLAALQPFATEDAASAGLVARVGAYIVDSGVLMLANLVCMTAVFVACGLGGSADAFLANARITTQSTLGRSAMPVLGLVLSMVYYAVSEGHWGRSLGKLAIGVRVAGPDGGAPGSGRALARAALLMAVPSAISWALLVAWLSPSAAGWLEAVVGGMWFVLLFSTIRRHNGWAGLHELLTRTRTVARPSHQTRPKLAHVPGTQRTQQDTGETIGPFSMIRAIEAADSCVVYAGFDELLRREVWIRRVTDSGATFPVSRADLTRPGRLRWLAGQNNADGAWEAYEAPSGLPLLTHAERPQPWASVRWWLADLAEELSSGLRDNSLPGKVGPAHVWITTDGRALLLDFPCPGLPSAEIDGVPCSPVADMDACQAFLNRIAAIGLHGREAAIADRLDRAVGVPVRADAAELLDRIGRHTFKHPDLLLGNLRASLEHPVAVSRWRRAVSLGIMPLLLGTVVMLAAFAGMWLAGHLADIDPELMALRSCLQARGQALQRARHERPPVPASEAGAPFDVYLAGRFRKRILDPQLWRSPAVQAIFPPGSQKIAGAAAERHPSLDPAEVADAEQQIRPLLDAVELSASGRSTSSFRAWLSSGGGNTPAGQFRPESALTILVLVYVVFVSLLHTACAVVFRTLPGLLAFGITAVDRFGRRASRLRLLLRSTVPLLFAVALFGLCVKVPAAAMAVAVLLVTATAVVWSVATPCRGPLDRVAGTWLVPR